MKPTRLTPAKDSTGYKWACLHCPTGDAGYLTWVGAWLVQRRHVRACRRITATTITPAGSSR